MFVYHHLSLGAEAFALMDLAASVAQPLSNLSSSQMALA